MKKYGLLTIFFLLCVFQVSTVFAQPQKIAEIKRIEAYCKTVDALVKRTKKPSLLFADTSDYNDDAKEKWRKFASEKSLEKYRENTAETYSIAYNWQRSGQIVKSNFTLFSPSGDWAEYVYHCFRADGTLAKAEQEMRTFNEDLILIQNFYFNQAGKLQKKTVKYFDLRSKKPIKPTKEFLRQIQELVSQIDFYKKVGKLPFAHLLKK